MRAGWRRTIGLLLVTVGCAPGERKEAARPDSAGMRGMGDMRGMDSMAGAESQRMMAEMRAHMATMARASADSLRRMMPMHRQRVANMLQRMDGEMRRMGMAGDTAWTALVDSVRQDLVQLPEVSAGELPGFMQRHRARVERLMQQHDSMMGQAH